MELWPQPFALGVGSRFYPAPLCFPEMQGRDAGPWVSHGPWCQPSGVLASGGALGGLICACVCVWDTSVPGEPVIILLWVLHWGCKGARLSTA